MVRLTKATLVFVMKQVISILRFSLPHLITLVLFCLGLSVRFSAVAVISSLRGLHPVATDLSQVWTRRAIEGGFPYIWEIYLIRFFYVLAVSTIITGWVIIFFTAVFTLALAANLIF